MNIAHDKTRYLVRIGVFGALAFVVMLFEFYIGFADYLKLDFSDIIAMIGGITMGPLAAASIQLIKNLLKALIITQTAGIGELANLLVGIAFVVPASYLFHRFKKDQFLAIGMFIGIICMVLVASFANYFFLLPLYFGNSLDAGAKWATIIGIMLPFNIVKGLIISVVSFILHMSMKSIYRYIL